MTYIKDDRRYMTYEERAVEDVRYRGKVKTYRKETECCSCGKTVIAYRGVKTGVTCPRECGK